MATYECSKCGMSVNATCGKCNEPLVNDMLKLDDGSEVQISLCSVTYPPEETLAARAEQTRASREKPGD